MLCFTFLGSKPTPEVLLACGSASTSKVFFSSTARLAARLMAVVVFPTPPFWLAIAMIFPILLRVVVLHFYGGADLHQRQFFPGPRKFLLCFGMIDLDVAEGVVMHPDDLRAANEFRSD